MIAAMINFTCPSCGRKFCVPADAAGRKGKCKGCDTALVVPAASTPAVSSSPHPPRLSMRARRLLADAEGMTRAFGNSPLIRILETIGNPPETYHLEYNIRGLQPGRRDEPAPLDRHLVEIQLTSEYPRLSPRCRMLTPVFHPNIDVAGTICIGDHWTAGERLVDLTIRIAEMLAYQAYNIKSPLNGPAAMWADLNPHRLPIDNRDLLLAETL